jgi:predicted transcriptional regulator
VTPAGVSSYLERPKKFVSATVLKEMEIENKIKDVWTKVELEPHLIRQIHESIRSEEQEQVQEKKEETSKSPNKLHQEALAAQMKSLSPEQQAEL